MMNFGDGDAQIVEFSPAFPNHGAFFRRTNQQGAASDGRAVGTELHGALRRPQVERTLANKDEAASYAAYRALSDLMPTESAGIFAPLMKQLGYDPNNRSMDIETPAGIGNVACDAVLEFRHHDGSNQLGDLAQGPYTDWSGYTPINRPNNLAKNVSISNPDRWQPLAYLKAERDLVLQRFLAPHWCNVIPFSLSKGDQLRGRFPGPASYGSSDYQGQAEELVALSAGAGRVGTNAHRHPACGFYGKEAEQCLKLILRR